jgi:hypothetical protein
MFAAKVDSRHSTINVNTCGNRFCFLTMSPLAARSAVLRSAATRAVARRQMSTEPKMHKAKDNWADLVNKRPPKDHLDEHVS